MTPIDCEYNFRPSSVTGEVERSFVSRIRRSCYPNISRIAAKCQEGAAGDSSSIVDCSKSVLREKPAVAADETVETRFTGELLTVN